MSRSPKTRQTAEQKRRRAQHVLVESLRDELILPLLPDMYRVLKRAMKGPGVRDLDVALIVLKVAGGLAAREQISGATLKDLLDSYVGQATKPDAEGVPDFFSLVREGDDSTPSTANSNRSVAAPHDLGAAG